MDTCATDRDLRNMPKHNKSTLELSEDDAVRKCYSKWSTSYFDTYLGNNALYRPVHVEIIDKLLDKSGAECILDAGCGPASMVRVLASDQREFFGFDITPAMIDEAVNIGVSIGIPGERFWVGDVIDKKSFTCPLPKGPNLFDAIICIGVLPHISDKDVKMVFSNVRHAVKPGGLVIVEARNQLFSLFTFNRYSKKFFMDDLLRVNELKNDFSADNDALDQALDEISSHFRTDLPTKRTGSQDTPGYDEILSLTHNPLTLKPMFEEIGFTRSALHFYNYHCLPPMFENRFPEDFRRISENMEKPDDWRGYFMASAFLLSGIRV